MRMAKKNVSLDRPENTQIDRTRQALNHIRKGMAYRKTVKKSIKLASRERFLPITFFLGHIFTYTFSKNISTD